MIVLGIETSCDETAAGIVRRDDDGTGTILSGVVRAQLADHAPYGGVVPEIAARAHVALLDRVVDETAKAAGLALNEVDAIAATCGPGLIGGLMVGAMTGKAIALATGRPFIAVNHLEAHALTARLTDGVRFPYLLLLVSGGHTQILVVHGVGRFERWGTTIDDALGEAFDKTAKLLGLGHPGGPAVEKAAEGGDATRFALPRPLIGRPGLDFSFAGLKTAVRLAAEAAAPLSPQDVSDLCASFQATVAGIVARRAGEALARFRTETGTQSPVLVVAGGVAANRAIRAALNAAAERAGGRLVAPPLPLCGDNGVMIAWAGAEHLALGESDGLDAPVRARWPLDQTAAPVVGRGRLGAKV
ncbi:tRNA (adenosine(37)-N6)-threonylcarbamoyltransferase complex transferase subunit TsaD [Pseudoxanthobacter sp.]|uniref:tRNA (adenosine(37)-N6)-threonylcarbamoyltransferase complex transferase subunit TsaD n=1 Tax=Pseudoxanthobacter sp. TaxID=1925742 RepID=UPI002FDFCADA